MSLSAIRDAIKDIIENDVSYPVGVDVIVHDYERWAASWTDILEKFLTPNNIYHSWTITRRSTESKIISYNKKHRAHIFSITGLYGLSDSDASEKIFHEIIEAVSDAFDNNKKLNDSCETTWATWGSMSGIPGLTIERVEQRMFGNVLCHVAECKLCAIEYKNI